MVLRYHSGAMICGENIGLSYLPQAHCLVWKLHQNELQMRTSFLKNGDWCSPKSEGSLALRLRYLSQSPLANTQIGRNTPYYRAICSDTY
jgi:hypothetical protein